MKPGFFADDTGALSCMRLMAFMAFAVVLAVWIWGNVTAGRYVPLGYAEAGIITAAFAGKAAQARFEYGGPYGFHPGGFPHAGAGNGGALPGKSGTAPETTPNARELEEPDA